MDLASVLRRAVLCLIAAVGFGPLLAKIVERWADRNGYLDDPAKGFHWLLSTVGSVTELWFFYPAVMFLLGLGVGLWIDRLVRLVRDNRSEELRSIGWAAVSLGEAIQARRNRLLAEWPNCAGDLAPDLQSLLIRLEKAGLWTPPPRIMRLNDEGQLISSYLRLLADGHDDEARVCALSVKSQLDTVRP
jgi:hypothetical protein